MAILRHKHGKTASETKEKIKAALKEKGYADNIEWNGFDFSSSIGFGMILSLSGKITEEEIIIDNCSGAISEIVLDEISKIL